MIIQNFHVDDDNDVFVAHFRTPKSTDLFCDSLFSKAVHKVCKIVMDTDIPQLKGECNFGDNGAEDLGKEILKFCTDVGYAELNSRHCECKAHNARDN